MRIRHALCASNSTPKALGSGERRLLQPRCRSPASQSDRQTVSSTGSDSGLVGDIILCESGAGPSRSAAAADRRSIVEWTYGRTPVDLRALELAPGDRRSRHRDRRRQARRASARPLASTEFPRTDGRMQRVARKQLRMHDGGRRALASLGSCVRVRSSPGSSIMCPPSPSAARERRKSSRVMHGG
ncbi:hypothetical protein Mp_4g10070 [Marchantia polymorpha subsp. ruderalis]|uniref:Uncharacterized protein n=2 Tax=Marchantia polymorpha TaxID=3197 RepID=A0AAF6B8B4_MARPO|nr:hypothetical protein MARPO_0132s0050 [Marchantia polymorpha]BBN08248.1 hypothetical protein Mp_4g10070 [Marchantia polymorpha subsp. ruderalis]|eukprot:PTQ29978.1 hypothetical protein MARPO_0132s0050 [Marchantia polymorpha]